MKPEARPKSSDDQKTAAETVIGSDLSTSSETLHSGAVDESTDEPKQTPSNSNTLLQQSSEAYPRTSHPVSKLSRLGWLLRVGANSAAVVTVAAFILVLIGLAQRSGWITADGFSGDGQSGIVENKTGGPDRYICPMMCTPPTTKSGRCPVCAMELVEASTSGEGDGKSIRIEPAARRLVGIQTAVSTLGHVTRTIRTIGSIEFDESRLSTISAYIDGRLEEMYADYIGVRVSAGDDLALIYSPQLYSAQTEFVTSLGGEGVGRFGLGESSLGTLAEENLSELGMSSDQIANLRKTGKPQSRIRIKSPQGGTVIEKSFVRGDYVKTGQKLYRIADLSTVWLMLDLFPDDVSAVRFGQQVEAEIQSRQGEVFTGRVAFIDPTVDPKTRTVRVRVEVMNFDGKLRPGDYATARITVPAIPADWVYDPALAGKFISPMHPQVIRDDPGPCPLCGMDLISTSELGFSPSPLPEQRVVSVPRDAVLSAGDSGVIYVETEPGRFEIRRVSVGPMTHQSAVIIEGLSAGEIVATRGNFLIDSQMQLAGNPSLLDPSRAPSFAPGPIELLDGDPLLLEGEPGVLFDRTYQAYFEIQQAMAADTTPPPVALNTMLDGLVQLELLGGVPDTAQTQFELARRAAGRLDNSLDAARAAFRHVSHALLRASVVVRGPMTAKALVHYHCPMVPGNGGDWMQPGGELLNPYWGSEMLNCGEIIRDLAVKFEVPSVTDAPQ